ncbi:membrane-spanning 4-domains subfamily A member 8-like [Carassius gibelio]|uniref:membrane-spanning 4-domains subfamily A member 8-like n=1 Tax=Carassius gibelio TaxID=101364 RepID=UPI00227950A8|nr:membrane-spanning 4-domains subfamily A member 8-like [Carassius gibelio]
METSGVISSDQETVVIHINPQRTRDGVVFVGGQQASGVDLNTALQGFFKAQQKTLGTVQIMIGVMDFLLGIVMIANIRTISTISGITIWGSFIYISAGSLSVAAKNKPNLCVLKASLGMNVISAITAGISIILISADIGIITTWSLTNGYYDYVERFVQGILGILLVFSVLQSIISISCVINYMLTLLFKAKHDCTDMH